MKKVSCASRAGCCCGWNNASKFQKELSTKLLVGISSKPIEKKISRNSLRTWKMEFEAGKNEYGVNFAPSKRACSAYVPTCE